MNSVANNPIRPTTIGILGIGGVGGFLGGLLTEHYRHNDAIQLAFLTRPATVDVIKEKGLRLVRQGIEFVSHPHWVGSNSDKMPQLDYLLCCTKSYDLEASLNQFKDSITNHTVIIPFQNGVNSRDLIKKLFPNNYVADGCVYIVSEIIETGVIEQKGDVHSFYFGHASIPEILLKNLETILQKAGIDAHYSTIIEEIIWEKFIFISSVASLTTFLGKNIGQIRENETDFKTLNALVDEAVSVAIAAGIKISPYTQTKTLKKIKEMPADSKSSMQRDFENNKQTEYQSLTKYMVEVGRNYGMDTPEFDKILAWFQSLNSNSK